MVEGEYKVYHSQCFEAKFVFMCVFFCTVSCVQYTCARILLMYML